MSFNFCYISELMKCILPVIHELAISPIEYIAMCINLFFYLIMQYFSEVRPLEAERFKALRIQWAQYYLKVRNQT